MKTENYLLLVILLVFTRCNQKKSNTESVVADSSTMTSLTEIPITNTRTAETKTVIHNFNGYLTYALTEDERESKIWNFLGPLIEQYDTTEFNTIAKNYTIPGTEETEDGTLNTSTTVTVTLYYNNEQELKAVRREHNYEVGDPSRFEKINTLYFFDKDLIAFYEDKEESFQMAFQKYTRGIVKGCPDCGITMSSGISSNEVTVSGSLSEEDFVVLTKAARNEESFLEYAYADSFQPSGNEYIYQTLEPMNQEADYDVFYTANSGYYEKFMKPKLGK
ncbi:MAG: hypothetical protein ACKVOQ_02745 [Cyclobacteriaceae bacterium]